MSFRIVTWVRLFKSGYSCLRYDPCDWPTCVRELVFFNVWFVRVCFCLFRLLICILCVFVFMLVCLACCGCVCLFACAREGWTPLLLCVLCKGRLNLISFCVRRLNLISFFVWCCVVCLFVCLSVCLSMSSDPEKGYSTSGLAVKFWRLLRLIAYSRFRWSRNGIPDPVSFPAVSLLLASLWCSGVVVI